MLSNTCTNRAKPVFCVNDISKNKNLYAINQLPLVTVYDDNWFVRNDYDLLSFGQRKYLIDYFVKQGFTLQSGQLLMKNDESIYLLKPNRLLAMSNFQQNFLINDKKQYYCVTPTTFAETLFKLFQGDSHAQITAVKGLINKCPYNIEWLRDISIHSDIEQVTSSSFDELMDYQKTVVADKFKRKKSL